MWVTRGLDRARRRLRGAPPATAAAAEELLADFAVSLARPELERVIAALDRDHSGHRPDSPALLADALDAFIARSGGTGRPSVTRSPAGLYTPEYWHIRVEGADRRARDAVSRLAAGGRSR